jgi:hypothetical protein
MEAALTNQPSCFNCDDQGGGIYKPHDVLTNWYIGHVNGQGHYACEDCKHLLFDATPINIPERAIMPSNTITLLLPVTVPDGTSPEEAAGIVHTLIEIGLDDAKTTIEEGEGDLDAAEDARALHIHHPTSVPASLEAAKALAIELLAPFLSAGEDGDDPRKVLNTTLDELLPRYDATRERFLSKDQRDVLIRMIVDQKNEWQNNDGEEIAEMVINGYWGYIDATDETLLERTLGDPAAIVNLNPANYSEGDIETIRQILAMPQAKEWMSAHDVPSSPEGEGFDVDIETAIQSIVTHLARRNAKQARP